MKKFWEKYKRSIMVIVVILIYHEVLTKLGNGCPIRFFTGVSCPGCGMTRAYFALLHLDLEEAFYYHPLFWTVPIVAICALLLWTKNERVMKYRKVVIGILVLIAAAFFVVYVVRFLDPSCEHVSIDIEGNGAVPRLIRLYQMLKNSG